MHVLLDFLINLPDSLTDNIDMLVNTCIVLITEISQLACMSVDNSLKNVQKCQRYD